mmetsp:Transcript_42882/g.79984  ORF Transcript_42882/g.79984 Transcript_42882/m.79984 type:complete len:333 (+) Transcript_42882:128-1126(+)
MAWLQAAVLHLLYASLLADELGEPCFEACGNFTGWCSWCGLRKACCRVGSGPEECSESAMSLLDGARCIAPSEEALTTLGVVSFSFDLRGLFYAAVAEKKSFQQDLMLRTKEAVEKILLNTAQPHQMAVHFSRGSNGFTQVHLTVMIPNGGEAVVAFAEARLCSMPSVARFKADAQNLDRVKFGEEGGFIDVALENRKVHGEECPRDAQSRALKRRRMQDGPQVWILWLGAGLCAGCCLTCAFLSFCNDHCKHKPVRGSARRHPREGKAQVSWKDSSQEEASFLPAMPFMASQESSVFSSQGQAQLSAYQQSFRGSAPGSAVGSWVSASGQI